jgi:rhomboid protease GluP
LHANLMHIAFNTYALYQAGVFVEFAYGTLRYAGIYMVALVAGSVAAYLSTIGTFTATLGASGAIMGIFGAMAVLAFKLPSLRQALLQSALLPIVLTLGYGFTHANVSNAAHVGGLTGGALCALLLAPARRAVARANG